ncbi:zeta toxin family protein, partial [Treponema sp. R6D11]
MYLASKLDGASPDYYAQQTNEFAYQVQKSLTEKLKANNFNVLVDGSARNGEAIVQTAIHFQQSNYTSRVDFVAADRKTAWESTVERYEETLLRETEDLANGMEVPRGISRHVGKEYFDSIDLPTSIDTMHKSGEFSRIRITDRSLQFHYDSNSLNVNPKEVLRNCIERGRLLEASKHSSVQGLVAEDALFIAGSVEDDSLGNEIVVTVIAAGFENIVEDEAMRDVEKIKSSTFVAPISTVIETPLTKSGSSSIPVIEP